MDTTRIEGTIRNGVIEIPKGFAFPDETPVLIEIRVPEKPIRIASPKLANPEDAAFFRKLVERDIED